MEELNRCPICGKEMHNNDVHLCGGTPTLSHICINGIDMIVRGDTKHDVVRKWNAFVTVVNR